MEVVQGLLPVVLVAVTAASGGQEAGPSALWEEKRVATVPDPGT